MGTMEQLFLLTADLDQSRQFYEDALGLAPERVGETSVSYATGECQLKLQADFEPGVLAEFNLPEPAAGRGSGVVSVLSLNGNLSDRYDQVNDAVAGIDAAALIKPRDVSWGERMFLVADPDGYVWEIRASPDE